MSCASRTCTEASRLVLLLNMPTSKIIRLDRKNGQGAVEFIETSNGTLLLVWEKPHTDEDAPRDWDVYDITEGLPGDQLL
jgi:hypothetical protein